ncbi:MAG: YihY/virulence factor BrkB family protein [Bacilli bacterium]
MAILPGHLAFFLILAIVPIITVIGFICSMFSISLVDITNFIGEIIPNEVEEILIPFLSNVPNETNIFIFMAIGIFLAANGASTIIVVSNSLYDIENNGYIRRRIKALFLTIILMTAFFIILILLAFGNIIFKFILDLSIFSDVSSQLYYLFILFKWPIAFLVVLFLVKVMYTFAPDKMIPSKYVNSGALFTTICWSIVTAIYSYYASNIANYNLFYGNLSNIIILMIWIYIISYIFVIGIAINVGKYKSYLEKMNNNEEITNNN